MSKVLFFGRTADRLGRSREVEIPPAGLSIADLRQRLCNADETARDALDRPDVRACVDQVIVGDDARIAPDQEIAFFSVFSGG
ncbi:MAG TPA: MoaD/ThiS family protein [Caulobacteraceae bacterium]|jgi:molybdopterin synthase sulfur carrier subunit|nr:MoaD/ThiS family protein [Caulobacteraceae bacterium]